MMQPRWGMLGLLLASFLVGIARANSNDDRIAARTACYKSCMTSYGWDPVCSWNPAFPNHTTHGGGDSVWPNECTAQCMAQYCRYGEWCHLDTRFRMKLPFKCYQKAWDIYISLNAQDPDCTTCDPKRKITKKPKYKPLPEDQCMKACVERDGWQPVCVEDLSNKKVAFGNSCAAECKLLSPTPLYKAKLRASCKHQFLRNGKFSTTCSKCPTGKVDKDLFIDSDRVVARQFCYKDCINRIGWDPICAYNPKYPKPTTHGGGDSVWPNKCTADCMSQYCKYGEWCDLQTKYKISLPKKCKQRMWDIYYLTANDPSAPQWLIKQCTTCPPPHTP